MIGVRAQSYFLIFNIQLMKAIKLIITISQPDKEGRQTVNLNNEAELNVAELLGVLELAKVSVLGQTNIRI